MPAAGDVRFMFFLLRMAFWLGLVLVLLPVGAAQHGPSNTEVSASEAISAASATVGDLRGFCGRQPDACTVGSQVARVIGHRAQAGAKMLYDVLSEAMATHETGSLADGVNSRAGNAKTALNKSAAERMSRSTLTKSDLTPAWRGPVPRKDGKHAA